MSTGEMVKIGATFFVGIVGILVAIWRTWKSNQTAIKINKESIKKTAITVERNAWKREVRKSISEFCGFTRHWAKGTVAFDKVKNQELLLKIDYLRSHIKLSLNPHGDIEKKILTLLDEIPEVTSKYDTLMTKVNEMENLTQALLKQAWEDIKNEAGDNK